MYRFRFFILTLLVSAGIPVLPVIAQDAVDGLREGIVGQAIYVDLLTRYVSMEGEVDYKAFQQDGRLQDYIEVLERTNPDQLSEKEAIAFWINAYNAYTIKLILDNYPVKTIKEITPLRIKGLSLAIPKINSPFEFELANINGKKYSLDDIEHKILRRQFDEPRIHFALVCASYSCPPLRREPFNAAQLDQQLDDQAHIFLNDVTKNLITLDKKHIAVSKIFKWFHADFTRDGNSLQQYLAQFFEGPIQEKLAANGFNVRYRSYNWKLNDVGSFNN